ncbi:MAG: hypothetical protein V1822_03830 [Candidatus Micrarchaeota archaeon]
MYHPGKIVEVFRKTDKDIVSADESVQATLEMWDENVLTLLVHPKIADKIKAGQTVLADYRPDEKREQPVPRHEIVKIISGKKAEKIWGAYKDMLDSKKRKANVAIEKQLPAQSYIG